MEIYYIMTTFIACCTSGTRPPRWRIQEGQSLLWASNWEYTDIAHTVTSDDDGKIESLYYDDDINKISKFVITPRCFVLFSSHRFIEDKHTQPLHAWQTLVSTLHNQDWIIHGEV